MNKLLKRNIKIYTCGLLSGIILMTGVNIYSNKKIKDKKKYLLKEFPKPKYEQSFQDTKEMEQYSFDYLGEEITIEGNSLEIYSFDDKGNMFVSRGKKVEKLIEDRDHLLDEYISEREALVFELLKDKDIIKDQFSIYLLFNHFTKLYEEYLDRKPFNNLENRKEIIYQICYDYIMADDGYTIGGYEFCELDKTVQKDILKLYKKINYMRNNNQIMEETKISKFLDQQEKAFKYILFKKGQ